MRLFLDTNVVISSLDLRDPPRQRRASEWLKEATRRATIILSPQVCAEVRSVAVQKLKISPEAARVAVVKLLPWCTAPQTGEEIRRALDLVARRRMSWWDALILASAIGARCTHLLTEDGQSANSIEGVTYVDPFAVEPGGFF